MKITLKDVGTDRVINLSGKSQRFIKTLSDINNVAGIIMPFLEAR